MDESVSTWSTPRELVSVVVAPQHLKRTVSVMLVVGTAFFAMNQLGVILAGRATAVVWVKAALTYLTPLLVSNFGILSATRRHATHSFGHRSDEANRDHANHAAPKGKMAMDRTKLTESQEVAAALGATGRRSPTPCDRHRRRGSRHFAASPKHHSTSSWKQEGHEVHTDHRIHNQSDRRFQRKLRCLDNQDRRKSNPASRSPEQRPRRRRTGYLLTVEFASHDLGMKNSNRP